MTIPKDYVLVDGSDARVAQAQALQKSRAAGDYAQALAPTIVVQSVAFMALSYLGIFSILRLLPNIVSFIASGGASFAAAEAAKPIEKGLGEMAAKATSGAVAGLQAAFTMPYDQRCLFGSTRFEAIRTVVAS